MRRFQPLIRRALENGLSVRGYLSTAFWCALEGRIAPEAVVDLIQRLFDLGLDEVSISDTIGKATPEEVAGLFDILLTKVPPNRIAVHFRDTCGRGVANVLASWDYGIRVFDASAGGLGGCPFAPGATGNAATEAVVAALAGIGVAVGVDRAGLRRAQRHLAPFLEDERRLPPAADAQACALCEFERGKDCCRQAPSAG